MSGRAGLPIGPPDARLEGAWRRPVKLRGGGAQHALTVRGVVGFRIGGDPMLRPYFGVGSARMLVGRQPECERIEALLDQARAGDGGVLAVRGTPGVGKSALLRFAIERSGA